MEPLTVAGHWWGPLDGPRDPNRSTEAEELRAFGRKIGRKFSHGLGLKHTFLGKLGINNFRKTWCFSNKTWEDLGGLMLFETYFCCFPSFSTGMICLNFDNHVFFSNSQRSQQSVEIRLDVFWSLFWSYFDHYSDHGWRWSWSWWRSGILQYFEVFCHILTILKWFLHCCFGHFEVLNWRRCARRLPCGSGNWRCCQGPKVMKMASSGVWARPASKEPNHWQLQKPKSCPLT